MINLNVNKKCCNQTVYFNCFILLKIEKINFAQISEISIYLDRKDTIVRIVKLQLKEIIHEFF